MVKASLVLPFVALVALSVGCNRTSPPETHATGGSRQGHTRTEPARYADDGLDQAAGRKRAIELQAQRAKREIDELTSEAEAVLRDESEAATTAAKKHARDLTDAVRSKADKTRTQAQDSLRKAREALSKQAKQYADEVQEYSAELAEDAKDRAEDAPDEIDESIDNGIKQLRTRALRLRNRVEQP